MTDSYSDHRTHLLDELRWLNRLLAVQVIRLRQVDFYDRLKDFRNFFIADEEVDALLAAGIFEPEDTANDNGRQSLVQLLAQAQSLRQTINCRVEEALAKNIELPLIHLAQRFHLTEFEQRALLICLAPELDARYEKLYAYLQNDIAKKSPSWDLILSLLAPTLEERLRLLPHFAPTSPLRHYGLLESPEHECGTSTVQHLLRIDPRIVQYLLGNHAADFRVAPHLHFLPPLAWEDVVVPDELKQRLILLLKKTLRRDGNLLPVFNFSGRSGVGKKTLARALCSEVGVPVGCVELGWLPPLTENFAEKVRLILREGLLQPCAIYFDWGDKTSSLENENAVLLVILMKEINKLGWLTFIGSENPCRLAGLANATSFYVVEMPGLDDAGQHALWEACLNGELVESDRPKLHNLTRCFNLTASQIAAAVKHAKQTALVRDPLQARVTIADLMASSRIQSRPKLSALARKIVPNFSWPDIILPEDQLRQLREIANQVKHRATVMHEWGFADKLALGRGLNALFAGPSGTGKTMAAEVIANDLGLDLYKIDLSAVVSKYIGETEKNLNRIFTEAEHSNVILFFDEADALLGKRSEVKDAHDRYANIEIAYLLQKMEEYSGITILSTNLKKNIDDAFVRRMQFIIDFPFPDEKHREKIWRIIFPPEAPIGADVDFKLLAKKLKITGGNIKNIGLKAAYFAATDGRTITMEHVACATKREFQKMGKLYMESDFYRDGKVLD